MTVAEKHIEVLYTPSSLVQIFNNSLQNEVTRKVFKVKGMYSVGSGINYKGVYFDVLKDETSDGSMTMVLPSLLRAQLTPNQLIECTAYLTKRVQPNGGRIELLLNVIGVLSQHVATHTDAQLRVFEILQKKAEADHKDVDGFITSKIIKEEAITVIILIGKAGIIDSDIKHQLKDAINFYTFHFVRINLSSEKEIRESLMFYQRKCDILGISRGGGEHLEIFDKPEIAEIALSLSTYFVTAIGHQANVPLLQKVADKPFITPTALGQYFYEIYHTTIAQLQNSKAKLVDDIKRQLEVGYTKQIENLNSTILNVEKSYQREVSVLQQQLQAAKEEKDVVNTQVKELQQHVEKGSNISMYTILLILVALVVGCLFGHFL